MKMKLHARLFVALMSGAYAQTQAPKPSTPPSLASPSPQKTAPAEEPVRGPFADLDPNRVIATIGEEKITAGQFDAIVEGIDPRFQAQVRGPAKRQFMEQYVMIKLLAKQ